jgi:hypothetical protein
MPRARGEDFWRHLSRTTPPLIDPTLEDIYECPVTGRAQYRGPTDDVNTLAGDAIVGACVHDDEVVVLRRTGDVMIYSRDDPVSIRALAMTRR